MSPECVRAHRGSCNVPGTRSYGVLGEAGGMSLIGALSRAPTVVVIAPPYDADARGRIIAAARGAAISEPGVTFDMVSFDSIVEDVARKAVPYASRGA